MEKHTIGNVCIASVVVREPGFLDYRYTAYKAAKDLGYDVYRNPENTGIDQTKFEDYLEQKRPIFILLQGKEQSETVKKEFQLALELGLPIIPFLLAEGGRTSPDALSAMENISKRTAKKDCCDFYRCEDLYEKVKERLMQYERDRRENPATFIHATQIYEKSEKMLKSAKKRIIICQRTSSLMLGSKAGRNAERKFYDELINLIKDADENVEIYHVFSEETTKEALQSTHYPWEQARATLLELCQQKHTSLIIRSTNRSILPCVICDNSMIVQFELGTLRYNLFLPAYNADGNSISNVVSDVLGMEGDLLFSSDTPTLSRIEEFYK